MKETSQSSKIFKYIGNTVEPNLEVLDRRDSGVFPLELVARKGALQDGAGVTDVENLSEKF